MPFERICAHCNINFFGRSTKGGKFCSTACYHAATKAGVERACPTCGKLVYRAASSKRQFCSKACELATVARIEKICPVCANAFVKPAKVANRFTVCSKACRLAFTPYINCARCGKLFTGERNNPRRFCSESCRRPPSFIVCATCNVTFRKLPGDDDRQFCSFACYRRSQGETLLEVNGRRALDAAGIVYQQEARIGRYSVDFLLATERIALEVDGAYWHRDDARDTRKSAYLLRHGWRVVRIGEAELNNAPDRAALILSRLQAVTGHDTPGFAPTLFDYPYRVVGSTD